MNKLYSFAYRLLWVAFKLVHPWEVVGNCKTPEGGVLLCGNHTTMSDPLYVALALGRTQQTRVMAKQELMRIPLLGTLLKKLGVIGVDRGKADITAIKAALKALKNGERLLIFPEGTRVEEGAEADAHSGAAMLAVKTNVPILPIYIPRKKNWFRKTTLVFGEPYRPQLAGERATPEDYKRISADLMQRILALGEQTT